MEVVVHAQTGSLLEHRPEPIAGGPDRERGLVDDQGAWLEATGDVASGGIDMGEVHLSRLVHDHRHDDDHRLGLADAFGVVGGRPQPPGADELLDLRADLGLVVVRRLSAVDGVHHPWIEVAADDLVAAARVLDGQG